MMPTFGSIIHDMIFEPLTRITVQLIEDDLTDIINAEPRCELISLQVTDNDHSVNVRIVISILPSKEVTELTIDLERE